MDVEDPPGTYLCRVLGHFGGIHVRKELVRFEVVQLTLRDEPMECEMRNLCVCDGIPRNIRSNELYEGGSILVRVFCLQQFDVKQRWTKLIVQPNQL